MRDADHLIRVMSTRPSYLRSAVDGQVKNLRDWGLPLGRRFRALKLWFLLRGRMWRGFGSCCGGWWGRGASREGSFRETVRGISLN